MFVVGLLCVCAAVAAAVFGIWSLFHARTADPTQRALRAMAPTQLAAGVVLAVGAVVALAASPHTALVVVIVCVTGAIGTLAAGSWQSARYVLRREASKTKAVDCNGSCAACTLSCH